MRRKRGLVRLRRVAVLPSLCTLANGVCGFASIIVASRIHVEVLQSHGEDYGRAITALGWAGWLIFLGMALDALDGRLARMSGAASRFGAELDSLCDVITFGAAPAFLLLKLGATDANWILYKILFVASTFYVMCTILRLARFNVESTLDEESHRFFKGLPSPAAAGCIASVAIARSQLENYDKIIDFIAMGRVVSAVMPFAAIGLGLLMVSTVRYPHLVNQSLRGRRPFSHLLQILVVAILVSINYELSLLLVFWGFALWGAGREAWIRRAEFGAMFSPEKPADPLLPE